MTAGVLALQLAIAWRSAPDRFSPRRAVGDLAPFVAIALAVLLLRVAVLGRFSPDPSTYGFAFEGAFEYPDVAFVFPGCGALNDFRNHHAGGAPHAVSHAGLFVSPFLGLRSAFGFGGASMAISFCQCRCQGETCRGSHTMFQELSSGFFRVFHDRIDG